MKVFLIIYNMAGSIVHVFGPVDQTYDQCQEAAARMTMQAIGRQDIEQLVFNCEYRKTKPHIQEFIKPRTTA